LSTIFSFFNLKWIFWTIRVKTYETTFNIEKAMHKNYITFPGHGALYRMLSESPGAHNDDVC